MGTIYTKEEIEILRESGRRLAAVLDAVEKEVRPGVSTKQLDEIAEKLIKEQGDTPAFLNYTPDGASRPFPASLCVSINDEIVHGIPSDERVLKDGDIVGIDLGVTHKGLITDSARTVLVGNVDKEIVSLVNTTKEALSAGIKAAVGGGRIGDIASAIENVAKKKGYGVIEVLGGHGVGHHVHEDPFVPNFGKKGSGPILKPGMVLALEPMLNIGSKEVELDQDGYTFKTEDGSISAHFEHTILITSGDAEILTKL